MKKHYFVAVGIVLPLLLCQPINKPAPTPDTDQPGYFSLTQLQGLQKTATITADTNTIDLGDLHSTTNYYFLLTNCGGHVITHINLSVSDSSFAIFPTSIDSLTVGFGTQALVPIIKLTAIHGTGAQGLGIAPIMTPGIHQVHINVSGTTKHNNVDTNTSLTATATINALVMDIDIHSMNKAIDLSTVDGIASMWRVDGYNIANINLYGIYDSNDSVITINNIGNSGITVKRLIIEDINYTVIDSICHFIEFNDSATFNIHPGYSTFVIDGNNTVCDPQKLQLQSNGKAYFAIDKN